MMDLIAEHIEAWTGAEITKANGGRGRGRGANGQSPHGIKKLRELILELAVRGKLVPQDPNDEPASVLLEKIAKEKARLVKEGKIKKQEKLPEVSEDEKPFELPQGWKWARLGDVQIFTNGYAFKSDDYQTSGVGIIRMSELGTDGGLDETNMKYISLEIANSLPSTFRVNPGDLLMGMSGSIGKLAVNNSKKEYLLNQRVGRLEPILIEKLYLKIILQTLEKYYLRISFGMAIKNLSTKQINTTPFPLPPLAEQHRIVAKVDELMALCDKLEQQQTDSNETHQTLVEALLATLTTVADPAEFAVSWQRIVAHFDTLFTTEESIDQLKQTILQLAVMGKLVPQDPRDEPAADLLRKIEKNRIGRDWIRDAEEQIPESFCTPEGWVWTRIANTVEQVTVGFVGSMKQHYVTDGVPFLRSQNVRASLFRPEGMIFISREFHNSIMKSALSPGDVVVVRSGNVGTACVIPGSLPEANCSDLVVVKRPLALVPEFLCFYLNSLASVHVAEGSVGVALTHFNTKSVATMPIALPPLAEQHRIVAKVDELLALCDTLKERLHDAQITQVQLADAIVEQAVA